MYRRAILTLSALAAAGLLVACGGSPAPTGDLPPRNSENDPDRVSGGDSTIWDIFRPSNQEQVVKVNKYIWRASLDVLSFLPIRTVDPFTGVIVTGYGPPPGGGPAYRATVYVSDPALEARSLKLALQSRGGPVSGATQRAIEDAILARARQLRGDDSRF